MTIEVALAVGAFLIVVILTWRKLRLMEARIGEIQKESNRLRTSYSELKEVHIFYSRFFMTVMNAKSRVEAASESQNAATKTNGEGVAAGHDAEVIALVPPTPSEAEHQTKDRGPVR